MPENLVISCSDCTMKNSNHCSECVVTFLLDRVPDDAVVIDVQEQRAMRALAKAGLVPGILHQRRAG